VFPHRASRYPITAVREIKILKRLSHECMVALREVVTSRGSKRVFDSNDLDEPKGRALGEIFVVLE
jgi:hypothetical protein